MPSQFRCDGCRSVYPSRNALASHKTQTHSVLGVILGQRTVKIGRNADNLLLCPVNDCDFARKRRRDFVPHLISHGITVVSPETNGDTEKTPQDRSPDHRVPPKESLGNSHAPPSLGNSQEVTNATLGDSRAAMDAGITATTSSITRSLASTVCENGGGQSAMAAVKEDPPASNLDVDIRPQVFSGPDPRILLDAATGYILTHPAFHQIGLVIHKALRVAICIECETCVLPIDGPKHCKSEHHYLPDDFDRGIYEGVISQMKLHSKYEDVVHPSPRGPPIPYIGISDGYACKIECGYATQSKEGIERHVRNHGPSFKRLKDHYISDVKIQTLFNPKPRRKWFQVLLELTGGGVTSGDPTDKILQEVLPTFDPLPPVTAPDTDRERTRFIAFMNWDVTMDPYRTNPQKLSQLKSLRDQPPPSDPLSRIQPCLMRYVKLGAKSVAGDTNQSFTVRKCIYHGDNITIARTPGVDQYWTPLSDNESPRHYCEVYADFIIVLWRSSSSAENDYNMNLTSEQTQKFRAFIEALSPEEAEEASEVALLHEFVTSLIPQQNSDNTHPLLRYFSMRAIRQDGNFVGPETLVGWVSKFKYLCHNATAVEGYYNQDQFKSGIIGATIDAHKRFIALGQNTLYNTLFAMQQYVSSLVYNQILPPSVWWSPDYQTINCYGHTLTLPVFRQGIETAIKDCWDRYLRITGGRKFATKLPEYLRDDLTNTTRGYSFLSHGPYTESSHACLVYLIRNSPWKLAIVDSEGNVGWNVIAIKELLASTAEFNSLLSVLTFILPTISTRVTQFLDHKYRNDNRCRNLFGMLEEMVLFTAYDKMTNQTGYDACTPAFFPLPLKELMLEYLAGGLRDCETLLASFAYGKEASTQYSRYLWVQNGFRVNPDRFRGEFQQFSAGYWNARLTPKSWRHAAVSIAREHIPPHTLSTDGDNVLDLASSHSTAIARSHYAITEGDLPTLTTDAICGHRAVNEAWHNICGVGPHHPPSALRFLRADISTVSITRSLADMKDGLKKDLIVDFELVLAKKFTQLKQDLFASFASHEKPNNSRLTPSYPLPTVDPNHASPPLPPSSLPPSSIPYDDYEENSDDDDREGEEGHIEGENEDREDEIEDADEDADEDEDEDAILTPQFNTGNPRKRPALDILEDEERATKRRLTHDRLCETSLPEPSLPEPSILGNILVPSTSSPPSEQQRSLPVSTNSSRSSDLSIRALNAIRTILKNPKAEPKSPQQLDAIVLALQGCETTVVLPTGGGKSMVWQALAVADPGTACAIVTPFKLLLEEQLQSSLSKGLVAVKWKADAQYPDNFQNMFLQPEQLMTEKFRRFVCSPHGNRLKYLCVDEFHDAVIPPVKRSPSWTKALEATLDLPLSRLFLTATFPPHLSATFHRHIHASSQICSVRASTNRPELGYLVIKVNRPLTPFIATVRLTIALNTLLQPHERMIVFHSSLGEVEDFANFIDCPYYHSQLTDEIKSAQVKEWDSGKCKILSATTAAAQGIDKPYVKFVVIHGTTFGMMTYVQEVGRMGRRGEHSYSFLVCFGRSQQSERGSRFATGDAKCKTDFNMYSAQDRMCRRKWILESMDGPEYAFTCLDDPGCNLCDVCDPKSAMATLGKEAIRHDPPMKTTRANSAPSVALSHPITSTSSSKPKQISGKDSGVPYSTVITPSARRTLDAIEASSDEPPFNASASTVSQPNTSSPDAHNAISTSHRFEEPKKRVVETGKWRLMRAKKAQLLDRYLTLVKDKCAVCFVYSGSLVNHKPFVDCGDIGIPSDFKRYKSAFQWEPYSHCFRCGCPQERNFNDEEPECHKNSRRWGGADTCPWKDFMFIAVHCIWHIPQRRQQMLQSFGLKDDLDFYEFKDWAADVKMTEGKFYNGLEVFLWYCDSWAHICSRR